MLEPEHCELHFRNARAAEMRDIAGGSQIARAKELKRSAAQLDGTVPNTGFLQACAGLLC